jgi:hypothetical protein
LTVNPREAAKTTSSAGAAVARDASLPHPAASNPADIASAVTAVTRNAVFNGYSNPSNHTTGRC